MVADVEPTVAAPVEEVAPVVEALAAEEPQSAAPEETVVAEVAPAPVLPASEVETFDIPGMQSGWSVTLPEDGPFVDENGNSRIQAVNGIPVTSHDEFDNAVRQTIGRPTGIRANVAVSLGETPETAVTESWTLPVVHLSLIHI